MMPLTDIHLHSNRQFELSPGGNIQYVYIFSAVALFILIIACINFMNLTTARSANRAREVGIRKVLGTEKTQLINHDRSNNENNRGAKLEHDQHTSQHTALSSQL